jgi:hypothetical protein
MYGCYKLVYISGKIRLCPIVYIMICKYNTQEISFKGFKIELLNFQIFNLSVIAWINQCVLNHTWIY